MFFVSYFLSQSAQDLEAPPQAMADLLRVIMLLIMAVLRMAPQCRCAVCRKGCAEKFMYTNTSKFDLSEGVLLTLERKHT